MAVTGFWPIYKNLKATLDYADNPDKTTYIVRVHFSETATETMADKIKRMLRDEVRKM